MALKVRQNAESMYFRELNIEENDVKLVHSSTYRTKQNGKEFCDAEFGFKVGPSKAVYVTCRDKSEGWFVCTECTEFQRGIVFRQNA